MIPEAERRIWVEHVAVDGKCSRCGEVLPTTRAGTVWISQGAILWVAPFLKAKVCEAP